MVVCSEIVRNLELSRVNMHDMFERLCLKADKDLGIALYKWDGENKNGRVVGAGSYLLIINGVRYFNFEALESEEKVDVIETTKLLIGVKE